MRRTVAQPEEHANLVLAEDAVTGLGQAVAGHFVSEGNLDQALGVTSLKQARVDAAMPPLSQGLNRQATMAPSLGTSVTYTMAPTIDRIDHIHVFVADRAASQRWYHSVLGFRKEPELAFWATGGGPLTLANDSGSVHLALFEAPARPCRSTVAFAVGAAEFVGWREHLSSALGKAVEVADHSVAWSMYFADPDGNPYEITCYEHAAVAAALGKGGG